MRLFLGLEDILTDGYTISRFRLISRLRDGSGKDTGALESLRVLVDCVEVALSSAVTSDGWIVFPKNALWVCLGELRELKLCFIYDTGFGDGSLVDVSRVLECISMAARSAGVTNWTSFRVVKTHRSADGINATYEIEIGTGALTAPTGGL